MITRLTCSALILVPILFTNMMFTQPPADPFDFWLSMISVGWIWASWWMIVKLGFDATRS